MKKILLLLFIFVVSVFHALAQLSGGSTGSGSTGGAELNQAVEPENQTCIYISNLMTADIIASKEVGIGEREVDIDLTSLPKGLYVVNLIENGVMIDNVKISLQ